MESFVVGVSKRCALGTSANLCMFIVPVVFKCSMTMGNSRFWSEYLNALTSMLEAATGYLPARAMSAPGLEQEAQAGYQIHRNGAW